MRKFRLALGVGSALIVVCAPALAQVASTNTPGLPQPTPIVHNDRPSGALATNAISEPSGSINTNRFPSLTNQPTPLAPDVKQNSPQPNTDKLPPLTSRKKGDL